MDFPENWAQRVGRFCEEMQEYRVPEFRGGFPEFERIAGEQESVVDRHVEEFATTEILPTMLMPWTGYFLSMRFVRASTFLCQLSTPAGLEEPMVWIHPRPRCEVWRWLLVGQWGQWFRAEWLEDARLRFATGLPPLDVRGDDSEELNLG